LIRFAGTLGPTAQEAAVTTAEQLHAKGFIEGRAEGREEGQAEGRAEGQALGQASLLTDMLAVKFGTLDNDTHDRVAHATQEQITLWSSRLVQGVETLDEVFRS
jgi:flagellar biosynthesis/type III secretory pathway protein FliH